MSPDRSNSRSKLVSEIQH